VSAAVWRREEHSDRAIDRILTAAGEAFVALGVGAVTMSDVARFAGCSRATVYRYFKTRDDLHVAYVMFRAEEVAHDVAARTREIADDVDRLVATVLEAVAAVRARPDLSAWFEAGQAGHTARLSGRPEIFEALAAGFAPSFGEGARLDARADLARRFVVRVIVSLLAMPGADETEEEAIVRGFVAPGVLADRDTSGHSP